MITRHISVVATLLATACQGSSSNAPAAEAPLVETAPLEGTATGAATPSATAAASTPTASTPASSAEPAVNAAPRPPQSAEIAKGLELATYCVGAPQNAKWIRAATWPPEDQPREETPSTCYLPWGDSEGSLGYAHPAGGSIGLNVIDGLSGCAQAPPDSPVIQRAKDSDQLLIRIAKVAGRVPFLSIRVRPLLGHASAGFSPTGWGTWRRVALPRRVADTVWVIPVKQLIANAPHRIQVELTVRSGPEGFQVQQVVDVDWPVSC